jgi:hypothetical protein
MVCAPSKEANERAEQTVAESRRTAGPHQTLFVPLFSHLSYPLLCDISDTALEDEGDPQITQISNSIGEICVICG